MEIEYNLPFSSRITRQKNKISSKQDNQQKAYSTVLKKHNYNKSKTTKSPSHQNPISRSSTEISLRRNSSVDVTPSEMLQYVINKQEQQVRTLMATQTATFKNILAQQEKQFQKTLEQITKQIPTMVATIVQEIVPKIIQQVQSSPEQITNKTTNNGPTN